MAMPPHQTRTDRLSEEVAEAILAGEFAPGARLDEQMLADRFGVSRTPVREVLRQLATTGLVETKPRRGAFVAVVTPADLDMLFGAMAEVEATCARLCALGMSQIERRRLGAFHDSMEAAVARNDDAAYAASNLDFHFMIYQGSHNDILVDIALGLRRRLSPYRRAQFKMPGRLERSHKEHAAVVAAILAADASAAHVAMLHHVSLVEDAYGQVSEAPRRRR